MNEAPVLSEEELTAFATEGVVVLDRPLSWEIIAELLAVLPASGERAGA